MKYLGVLLVGAFLALTVCAWNANWQYYEATAPTDHTDFYPQWLHEHVIVLGMTETFWMAAITGIPGCMVIVRSTGKKL